MSDNDHRLGALRELLARHASDDTTTAIDGVLLARADGAQAPSSSASGTVFALIARGGKRLAIGDRVYEYRSGQFLIASVDLPVTGHYFDASPDEPALGFGLQLRPELIAALLLERPPLGTPLRASVTPPALGVADASDHLLDAVTRMVGLLDRPHDQAVLAPLYEREIVWLLLTGPLGPSLAQIGLADSATTQISRAVQWIGQHYDQPFRVDDLASSCGFSTSVFHRKFQAVTGLSPIQFQKQLRLHQARLLLMAGSPDVAAIAHRVGYDSATQFNREYRRHFGAPPGQDAARLRAGELQAAA